MLKTSSISSLGHRFTSSNPRKARPALKFGTLLLVAVALVVGLISIVNGAAVLTASRVYGQLGEFNQNGSKAERINADSLSYLEELAVDASGGLYVADKDNNRVLYYAPGSTTASRLYGQPNYNVGLANPNTSATSLTKPAGVAVDASGGLYVADTDNNRVLFYASGSVTATRVYGQANAFDTGADNKGGLSANSLKKPESVSVDPVSGGLYVGDTGNHRVLYFAPGDTQADRVYGQGNVFNTDVENKGGVSANSLRGPQGIATDSAGNLYVADQGNNRVLFYLNEANTQADRVYGQGNAFNTRTENKGGSITASTLYNPQSVAVDGSGVYVTDQFNNRALFYPGTSVTASRVYGQADFASDSQNRGGSVGLDTLSNPIGIATGANGVFIADDANNRVLFFFGSDTLPTRVYGQLGSFTQSGSNFQQISAKNLDEPGGVATSPAGVYFADSKNNRVLFYPGNSIIATRVYGQADFASNEANRSPTLNAPPADNTLKNPTGLAVDATGGLYIADTGNHRVLYIANADTGSTALTRVYGQPSPNSNTANNGGRGAGSLNGPTGVSVDGAGGLYIADTGNHRVLYFTSTATEASRVYGQLDFTVGDPNRGSTPADNTLNKPAAVAVDSTGLYIADTENHRALFYASTSVTATRVYGQGNVFTTGQQNKGGVTKDSLGMPSGIAVDSTGLYIADTDNHRVLFFVNPASNNTGADFVYGQGNLVYNTATPNKGGLSATTLFKPLSIALDASGALYIADTSNNRGLFLPSGNTTITLTSSDNPSSLGQSVTLTALVTSPGGTPTGSVNFFIDNNPPVNVPLNADGVATLNTPASLATGSHPIYAVYVPTANSAFTASTSETLNQVVGSCKDLTVTNASDNGSIDGCGTLSHAIFTANNAALGATPVTITVSAGLFITLNGTLPELGNVNGTPIVLNGGCTGVSTKPGTPGASLLKGAGFNGTPLVLKNRVAVYGFRISGFSNSAIQINGDNNVIACNWLGTSNGINPTANNGDGIRIGSAEPLIPAANNNFIGLPNQPRTGNLIAASTGVGIRVVRGTGNEAHFNWLGLTSSGAPQSTLKNAGGAIRVAGQGVQAQLKFGLGNRAN